MIPVASRHSRMALRGAFRETVLAGFVGVALSFSAAAQDGVWSKGSMASPPMPPARPASLGMAAAPLPQLSVNAPPPGVDPMVANFAADMPETLPAASRSRMHACGREWQKMKASGAAVDKTWLTFARVCLVQGK